MLSGSPKYANRAIYTARPNALARSRSVRRPSKNSHMFAWLTGFQRRADCAAFPNCSGTLWPSQTTRYASARFAVWCSSEFLSVGLACPIVRAQSSRFSCFTAGATAVADIALEPEPFSESKTAALLGRSGSSSSEAAADPPFVQHTLQLNSAVTYLPHPDKVITGMNTKFHKRAPEREILMWCDFYKNWLTSLHNFRQLSAKLCNNHMNALCERFNARTNDLSTWLYLLHT